MSSWEDRTVLSQGGLANAQGRILEDQIIPAFTNRGFKLLQYSEWLRKKESAGTELLLKNAPYTSIYGHQGKTEFLVKSSRFNLEVRIECKWQQSSGSVDEKYPYLYFNCVEAIPEADIIIVYGGGGMKQGAIDWLKNAAQERKYQENLRTPKNIRVFTLEEFLSWTNQRLRA